jgi:Zn-dependent protease with chaperone function
MADQITMWSLSAELHSFKDIRRQPQRQESDPIAMTGQPIDRVHFLDEQRRNRRRSRRFTVFAVVAVAVSGIPLCVIAAPLLLGVIIAVMHVGDLVAPFPQAVWDGVHDVVFALPQAWSFVRGRPVDFDFAAIALIYVVPGAALMVMVWPFILALSRRAGAGTMLELLSSRAADMAIPVERQLTNVVEEMAIAAGVAPPGVRIIESEAVNAVAVGLTVDDATILVTTGFLQRLDRDERQSIVAHLMGSVGNGDLAIAATILSVIATWGLISLLLEAPISVRRRKDLGRLFRISSAAMRGRMKQDDARDALGLLLAGSSWDMGMLDDVEAIEPKSPLHGCLIILLQVPLIAVLGLSSIAARTAVALCAALGLGPWLAAMWRNRRRLADASAVQLTRNPTALARAVRTLASCDVEVPGGWVAYFLFPVWVPLKSEADASRTEAASNIIGMRLDPDPRVEDVVALGAMLDVDVRRPGWRTRLARLGTAKDVGLFAFWTVAATAVTVVLVAVTLATASLVLMALWQLGRWVNPRR